MFSTILFGILTLIVGYLIGWERGWLKGKKDGYEWGWEDRNDKFVRSSYNYLAEEESGEEECEDGEEELKCSCGRPIISECGLCLKCWKSSLDVDPSG